MFGTGTHLGQFSYAAVLTRVWTCGCRGRVGDCGSSLRKQDMWGWARTMERRQGRKVRGWLVWALVETLRIPHVIASRAVEAFAPCHSNTFDMTVPCLPHPLLFTQGVLCSSKPATNFKGKTKKVQRIQLILSANSSEYSLICLSGADSALEEEEMC